MRSLLIAATLASCALAQAPTAHHAANFEAERAHADALFSANKLLEALPLYADLVRQDPTVGLFAERYAAALLASEETLSEPQQKLNTQLEAVRELKRAWALGDHSEFVRVRILAEDKTFLGAVITGVPLTVGYTYHGNAEAQAAFHDAGEAFSRKDLNGAAGLYIQAANHDPAWYDAALFAGDTYFRLNDAANAGLWFARAIAIDPDRETAFRYWGDALFRAGDRLGARDKFVAAVVAEPYGLAATNELTQWAAHTGHLFVKPAITRPPFLTPNGQLQIDADLAASTLDGRSSWIVYQQYRVAHGARTLDQPVVAGASDKDAVITPNGYRHTIAEEHAALRAMLADINAKLAAGTLTEASLDPSIRNIRALEKDNFLGAWIALNAADAGIRSDYPDFRAHHRKHLADYLNAVCLRPAPAAALPTSSPSSPSHPAPRG